MDRHRADFAELADRHVDILFANEEEIMSLFQVETFDEALAAVRGQCKIAALTRNAEGCVIASGNEVFTVVAEKVEDVVDTTGAGDAFASGFPTCLVRLRLNFRSCPWLFLLACLYYFFCRPRPPPRRPGRGHPRGPRCCVSTSSCRWAAPPALNLPMTRSVVLYVLF